MKVFLEEFLQESPEELQDVTKQLLYKSTEKLIKIS